MKSLRLLILFLLFFQPVASPLEPSPTEPLDYSALNREAAREMTMQDGHSSGIIDVDFSSDGRYIASLEQDGIVKIWTIDGRLIRTIHGKTDFTATVRFSPDGEYIVIGSPIWVNTIQIWGIDGKLLHCEDNLECLWVGISPDSDKIHYQFDGAGGIKTIDRRGKTVKTTVDGYPPLPCLSPDGEFFAIAYQWVLRLIDMEGKTLEEISLEKPWGWAIAVSHDSGMIALTTETTVTVWSREAVLLNTFEIEEGSGNLRFSRDDKHLLVESHSRKRSRLYDLKGNVVQTFEGVKGRINADDNVLTVSEKNEFLLHSPDGKLIRRFGGQSFDTDVMAISPDNRTIAVASSTGVIHFWEGHRHLHSFPIDPCRAHHLEFAPDGKSLWLYSWLSGVGEESGNRSRFDNWSLDGTLKKRCYADREYLRIAFTPGWDRYAVYTDKKTVTLFSIDGKPLATFPGNADVLDQCNRPGIAFSPDGSGLAVGMAKGEAAIGLWNLDGTLVREYGRVDTGYHGRQIPTHILFSPDGRYLLAVTSDYENINTLYAIDGKTLHTFREYTYKEDANVFEAPQRFALSACFSPDSKYFATGSKDSLLRVYSVEGSLLETFRGHHADVEHVFFLNDSTHLVSSSYDSPVRVWNRTNGKNAIFLAMDGEWAMFTPDGHFDASRNGGRLVGVTRGMKVFGIDQVAVKCNRPDLILEDLDIGGEPLRLHYFSRFQRRLKKLGLSEKQLSQKIELPEAGIVETSQEGKELRLTFKLTDSRHTLVRYNLFVNDVPLFGAAGKPLSGKDVVKSEVIELTAGRNKIEVSCINDVGYESFRTLTYADCDKKPKADLYYIGFGVSEYSDRSLNLKYAHKDARDLAELFRKMSGAFREVHVKIHTDEEVTVRAIEKARNLLRNARPEDLLVLFIAGHGVHDSDREATYYYLTHNADLKNLAATAARFELIENILQGIPPRHKLFLMDTCESGEVEEEKQERLYTLAGSRGLAPRTSRGISGVVRKKSRNNMPLNYLLDRDRYIYNDLLRRSGAIVFSSSRGGEFSFEKDEFENGLFTEQILNCFSGTGADVDQDGVISMKELRNHVITAVPKISDNLQHPTVDRDNIYIDFGFPLGRSDQ